LGANSIKPEVVFGRIENAIKEQLNNNNLPPEFKLEFQVKSQTLKFNMIDEKDVKLIVEGLETLIINIQEMVVSSNRSEYQETIYFPFGKHVDRSRASMIINLHYRQAADFVGDRVTVRQII
jgi:hypothetical protein